jgi:undecaprenyl-diphosphatase
MPTEIHFPDLAPAAPEPPRMSEREWLAWFGGTGLFGVVALLGMVLARDGGALGPDLWAQQAAMVARGDLFTSLSRALDNLFDYRLLLFYGAAWGWFAWVRGERRLAVGAFAVPAGLGLLLEAVKRLVDRPRPLVWKFEDFGSSFPSGHAAGSLAFCLLSLALIGRLMRPGSARLALTIALIALPFATGLSRVYLGVHYFSDVLAGWFLGTAWFCACWGWVRAAEVPPWEK